MNTSTQYTSKALNINVSINTITISAMGLSSRTSSVKAAKINILNLINLISIISIIYIPNPKISYLALKPGVKVAGTVFF